MRKSVKKTESLPVIARFVFFSFRSFPLTKSLKQAVSGRGKSCSSEYCLLDVHSVCVQFTVRNTAFLCVSETNAKHEG